MNCCYCTALARFLVDGANGRFRVCDDHLPRAWKAAGVPRSTTLIDAGLFEGFTGGDR